jgi:short-subunit dehydrogenase
VEKWLNSNTSSLKGKTVALTGATGGLGRQLTMYLSRCGAELLLLDRNKTKSLNLKNNILKEYPNTVIGNFTVDLEDINSVKTLCDDLKTQKIDILILNAGAYKIPRKICDTGFDNVFQINFVSQYYLIKKLLPQMPNGGRVVVVGSIAHNYSKIDKNDIDFSTRRQPSLVYGNAKRYLMFSAYELFKNVPNVSLSVVHPGITLTGITAHYPKFIFAVIKYPMKVIFMHPKKAALSLISGVFNGCGYKEWIGPRVFNVWGLPKKKTIKTCQEESKEIFSVAEKIYSKIESSDNNETVI